MCAFVLTLICALLQLLFGAAELKHSTREAARLALDRLFVPRARGQAKNRLYYVDGQSRLSITRLQIYVFLDRHRMSTFSALGYRKKGGIKHVVEFPKMRERGQKMGIVREKRKVKRCQDITRMNV